MAGLILRAGFFALVGSFIWAVVWTEEGPNQRRHRRVLFMLAAGLGLLLLAVSVAAGIAEGLQSTPETDSNQWGVGWVFTTLTLSFPVVIYAWALATVAWKVEGSNGSRIVRAIAIGLFAGVPTWLLLVFLMDWLENRFHP